MFYHNDILLTERAWPFLCDGGGGLTSEQVCADAGFDWVPAWTNDNPDADCRLMHYLWGSAASFPRNFASFRFRNNLFVSTENRALSSDHSSESPIMDLDYNAYWRLGSDDWFPGIAAVNGTAYDDPGGLHCGDQVVVG